MDWGTIAWHIFWCLLLAFLLGFILGWLLNWLFGKDRYAKYEADLSAKDKEIRGLKTRVSAASGDASASTKFKADLSACHNENADLKARLVKLESDSQTSLSLNDENEKLKARITSLENAAKADLENYLDENARLNVRISSLEGDLADAKSSSSTTAATIGAIGGSLVTGAVKGDSKPSESDEWNNDYGKIRARLDELEVLATDDEEDTDEELQAWILETESLQTKISAFKSGANSDETKMRLAKLDIDALTLLEILRKSRADKAAGIAKIRRQGYGSGIRDDLKEIIGVGPVLEKVLNGLSIWTFKEIALWSPARVAEVSEALPSFQDRIEREDWIGQSKQLHFKHYGENV